MYHTVIRQKITKVFEQLSRGEYEPSLAQIAVGNFEHKFPGNHCLGGTRHTVDGMRRWFRRLFVLFPRLEFEIKNIFVKGGPVNTLVAVEWIDRGITRDDKPYDNCGTHILRLQWGRLVSIHVYLDSQKIAQECQRMTQQGIAEAAAPPIEDY